MDALDPQLRKLLEAHKSFFNLTDNGKIECTLNGHTLPARLDAVSSFIKGAKFQKLSRRQTADQALQKYEPFIVQSNNFPLMLYCALTGQLIDKSVEAVKKHMKGKKFQRAKDRFAADDLELKPEPTLESFGIKPSKGAAANQQQQQPQQEEEGAAAAPAAAAAGNGAAAGSEDEPGFWVPEGVESGSSSGGGQSEEEGDGDADGAKPGSSSTSSGDGEGSDADAADADMETGPAGDSGDDPMEEDTQPAAAVAKKVSKAGSSKSSSKGGVKSQQKQKQKQQASKSEGAAQNGAAAAAGAAKKRNAQRPSAAKKARR